MNDQSNLRSRPIRIRFPWRPAPLPSGLFALLLLLCPGPRALAADCSVRPVALACGYETEPIDVEAARPPLGWRLEATRPGDRSLGQSAFRIQAATDRRACAAGRADLWDSGRTAGSGSIGIPYAGRALRSGEQAFWRVRVWDCNGLASAWSEPASFEAALLHSSDWKGCWIASPDPEPAGDAERFADRPAPLLRRAFQLPSAIRRARLYVSGLGFYEIHLNGRRVGDYLLEPGWTAYAHSVPYSAYDVTSLLRKGGNAIGALLGNGWYDPLPLKMWGWLNLREHLAIGKPRLRLQLNVELADGSRRSISTDESWRTAGGPILRNSIYLGEVYDANHEIPGWDRAGFDDRAWRRAIRTEGPGGALHTRIAPPIRVQSLLRAAKLTEPRPGLFIVDFGQNFAGLMRMRLCEPRFARIVVRYGELLNRDGTLNPLTSCGGQIKGQRGSAGPETAWQTDTFISRGVEQLYTPRFTWHGFRYAEVSGLGSRPSLDRFTGVQISADVPGVAQFACSNEMLNAIHRMARWTFRNNLMSVQSDCPHRERFGYGGDILATSDAMMDNFDMSRFYAKACRDLDEAARTNGGLTETAPFVGIADGGLGGGSGPIEWGTALPWLMWRLFGAYGERQPLVDHYAAAKRWVDFLLAHAKGGILDTGLGDHETITSRSTAVTGTAFLWDNCTLLGLIAFMIGRHEDASRYTAEADRIERAFAAHFLNADTGRIDAGTQADQAAALRFGLIPEASRPRALEALLADIAAHDHHLTTGIFGTPFLLWTLSDTGHAGEAYRIVTQRTFPGWGFMLANGATTLWEHWDFSDNTFSHNHPMFGSVDAWLMEWIAGIRQDPLAVGFSHAIIRPQPVGDLTWAEGTLKTVRGVISTYWTREGGSFRLHVRIPPNVRARIYLPTSNAAAVRESGRPLSALRGGRLLNTGGADTAIDAGSGSYDFTWQSPS
jgi:alpha-L-rhamnosidase